MRQLRGAESVRAGRRCPRRAGAGRSEAPHGRAVTSREQGLRGAALGPAHTSWPCAAWRAPAPGQPRADQRMGGTLRTRRRTTGLALFFSG